MNNGETILTAGKSRRAVLKGMTATGAFLAVPSLLRAARAQTGPIRIGVISPLTGAWTVYGKAHSAGFELAVEEINKAGGVLGRQLEIVIGDSKTEPRIVVEQANRLIRQEQVDFLAGTFSSAERNAAGPVVRAADKVLLYPTFYEGQEKEYVPGVCNPNIFMFGPEPTQQVWPHMDYIAHEVRQEVFMIGSDYAGPSRRTAVTKQQARRNWAARSSARSTSRSTRRSMDRSSRDIKSSGADIIFHYPDRADTVNFRQQFAAAGMKEDFVVWTVDDEEVVDLRPGPRGDGQ